ncbi:hypothetical protein KAFR_0C01100 [Kazachstania africana CBS 2517]|uniref:Deacetylase sirtuin-type domain-containing protein n=1 Tax=Kazachstania africana (strain ATCC 22294 / BCRC 22015 / CBS 2517 / CECT 1963 / NBRC 1671 / NRRL Y-8276) TaxID=1071382 RepID=H2ARV5_KAZAF|nr:hypothetical protein KAFR_0C01100 [Kazachstania africana CBS 2517]CCF57105.1 hypothetical protein KAFR_0C01100 [Kazachstania africana CBS 2517]
MLATPIETSTGTKRQLESETSLPSELPVREEVIPDANYDASVNKKPKFLKDTESPGVSDNENDVPLTNIEPLNEDREALKPRKPAKRILIGKDHESGKYVFPEMTKDDTVNARMHLKYYGLKTFLDSYLPENLNSLYIYYLIKLLGFEIKDRESLAMISRYATMITEDIDEKKLSYDEFEDPLEKKLAVKLVKDLQKAINKVLSTRISLSNFYTLDHMVAKLKTAKRIIVLTGAGVSTSLGIPDFRSSEGFYSKIKHLGLDDPQDVFNLDIFLQDPSVFYNIAHLVLPPENIYSPLHSFIKMLQDKGKLLRNYTQNIDNLESYAGIKSEKLVQCHGSFATASCITCHWQLPGEKIFDNIRKMELPLCPYCYHKRKDYFPLEDDKTRTNKPIPIASHKYFGDTTLKSYGVLKPDITFFGEALPSKFHKTIREDVLKCDLLLCIGTSLKVAPVSEIVNMLPAHVPQILINRDPVKHAEFDIDLLGFCDDVAALVAQKCGWEIPHESWDKLKDKKFDCIEREKGAYNVKSAEQIE